jgi:hypothetical protein
VGSVRGESVGVAMVDLNGHEAGNGGHSQGMPKAHRPLSYSERFPTSRSSSPHLTNVVLFAAIGQHPRDAGYHACA